MSFEIATGRRQTTLAVGETTYTLCTPTVGDWLHTERELRSYLGSPLRRAAEVAKHIPPDQWAEFWRAAHRAEIDWRPDIQSLLAAAPLSVQTAAVLLACIRQRHPSDASLARCLELVEQAGADMVNEAILIVCPPEPSGDRPTSAAAS